jgi:hypothetical protein
MIVCGGLVNYRTVSCSVSVVSRMAPLSWSSQQMPLYASAPSNVSAAAGVGGVVDEDVDAAEAFYRTAHDLVGHAGGGDVARHSEGTRPERRRQRLGACGVADVDGHTRAALVQSLGDGAAQATRGAGDDGDADGEVEGEGGAVGVLGILSARGVRADDDGPVGRRANMAVRRRRRYLPDSSR